jgi:hypothetical protein
MFDRTDDVWTTDGAGQSAWWAEMDAFLKRCERDRRPKSDEERVLLQRQFLEVQERCTARMLAAFDHAIAAHPAPQLRIVRTDDEVN